MTHRFAMIVVAFALALGSSKLNSARAELKTNPDENTLWIEDGQNVQASESSSEQHWNSKMLNISTAPGAGGGVLFDSPDSKKYNTGLYAGFDPVFPYLVWEVSQVTPGSGYQGFNLATPESVPGSLLSMGGTPTPQIGLYTINTSYIYPTAKKAFLRMDIYNTQIVMKYMKVVRTPANYLDISSPAFATKKALELGDEVTFKVVLADDAEDVSLRFVDGYKPQLTINGSQTLQLKTQGGDQKVWTATLKIDSCTGAAKPGEPFRTGMFLVKAIILGGKLGTPIWTANPVEFRINPAAK